MDASAQIDHPDPTLEELLFTVLDNVNAWLKFAEAKNGALVSLNIAAVAVMNALAWGPDQPPSAWLATVAVFSSVCLLISTVIAAGSFSAKLDIPEALLRIEGDPASSNLIFFGSLARCDAARLAQTYRQAKGMTEEPVRLEIDIADQIVRNSSIALKKYALFNIALWITIAGLASPILALAIYKVVHD